MSGPPERFRRRGEGVAQRLLALGVFVTFGVLVWLAYEGRYDHTIHQIAAWLRHHVDAIAHLLH